MPYCTYCGTKLDDNAVFCKNCGEPVAPNVDANKQQYAKEEQTAQKNVYNSVIHKCPNCGEVIDSFVANCPACGHEFRDATSSSAVREFALKLEKIEAGREYEKPHGLFAAVEAQQSVSKTDKQKISLIKSFSVPNTKEDMLEFMILATSSINMNVYDSTDNVASQSEKEINDAWLSKVEQVYEKAKRVYSKDDVFAEITELYNQCKEKIKKPRKKRTLSWDWH